MCTNAYLLGSSIWKSKSTFNLLCPKLNSSSPNHFFSPSSVITIAFPLLRPTLRILYFVISHIQSFNKSCHLALQKPCLRTISTTPFYPSPSQDHSPKLFQQTCFTPSALASIKVYFADKTHELLITGPPFLPQTNIWETSKLLSFNYPCRKDCYLPASGQCRFRDLCFQKTYFNNFTSPA